MERGARTGRLIVKRARVLPLSPGMEPTWRQSQEPQERPQWNKLSGTIHGAQNPGLGASVGQTLVLQRKSRTSKQSEGKPKYGRELLHASPELQDFLVEFRCPLVRDAQAHHNVRCLAEPSPGRRARDPRSVAMVPSPVRLDEIPKPVVVALLWAGRSRRGNDHRPFPHAAQLLEDDRAMPLGEA
jgi:hypothetical protein